MVVSVWRCVCKSVCGAIWESMCDLYDDCFLMIKVTEVESWRMGEGSLQWSCYFNLELFWDCSIRARGLLDCSGSCICHALYGSQLRFLCCVREW